MCTTRRARGLSLVELIVFIVVVSVAAAGVLAAMSLSTRASADPLVQKQALAIAEAVLEEVQLQPYTYCDPDDANAATATQATTTVLVAPQVNCAETVEGVTLGAEAGNQPSGSGDAETRTGAVRPFDNVNDYNTFDSSAAPAGIRDVNGNLIDGLTGYRVTVAVARQALQGVDLDGNSRPQSLLVTVTVTGPGNTTVRLDGYRLRYAPNALP